MKEMVAPGQEQCPFEFNFDETTFKPGDIVSYRVEDMWDMPFVGVVLEVYEAHIILAHDDGNRPPQGPRMRGTRESRPLVSKEDALQ